MSDLQALLDRVKAATGPDRELDAAIWLALVEKPERGDKRDRDIVGKWPTYTSSIDASVALVERKLPEHDYIIGKTNGGLTIHCQLGPENERFGDTVPLAILTALLTALLTQSERPE